MNIKLKVGQKVLSEDGIKFEIESGDYLQGELVEAFDKKTDAEKKAELKDAIKMIVDSKWANVADRKSAISAINKIMNSSDEVARKLIKAIDKATTEMDNKDFNI